MCMSEFITKVFLHPLFHFFFWLAAAVWLFLLGLSESSLFRWVDFILSLIFIGSAIDSAVKTFMYCKNYSHK